MDWTALISPAITILTSGFIIKILGQQIKSQQEQMNAMKNNMDAMKGNMESMEKVAKLINIDEIEKYYERKTANAVQDALNNPDIYVVEEIQRLLKSDLESQKLANELLEKQVIFQKYAELLARTCTLLKNIPAEKRNAFIDKKYPHNVYEIKEQMKLFL